MDCSPTALIDHIIGKLRGPKTFLTLEESPSKNEDATDSQS